MSPLPLAEALLFVGLLCLLSLPFFVKRVRRNRRKPGLLGKPFKDSRQWSATYMDSLKQGRF